MGGSANGSLRLGGSAKGIVRIPVATAMEEVLKSREFRSGARKKSDGRIAPPGRSNSGGGSEGDKP